MMFRQIVSLAILILSVCGCSKTESSKTTYVPISIKAFSDDWTCSLDRGSSGNFTIAEFRLWVPDPNDVSNLKAILVLANHYNSYGLGMALSDKWQAFAISNSIGILGVNLKSLELTTSIDQTYVEADGGSGQALIMALEAIAIRNNIPEVASLPFLMRGYSGGGMFCYSFSFFKPQRVIAFANIRGPILSPTLNENKDIPGLMLLGEFDDPYSNNTMKRIVKDNRIQDGLWNYAVEPNVDHYASLVKSDELIKLFFTSVLVHRVSVGSNELFPISVTSGWLGNNVSKAVFSYSTYPDIVSEASWLIDENFANEWSKYQMEE